MEAKDLLKRISAIAMAIFMVLSIMPTAIFQADEDEEETGQYEVSFGTELPTNGTIAIGETELTSTSVKVAEGETLQLFMTPDTGYYLSVLKIGKTDIDLENIEYLNGGYCYTIDTISSNTEIEVAFAKVQTNYVAFNDEIFTWKYSHDADKNTIKDNEGLVESILTYGENVILSVDDAEIAINDETTYADSATICTTTKIDSITVRKNSGSLEDSTKTYALTTPIKFVVDSTPPSIIFDNKSNEVWLGGKVTSQDITFSVEEDLTDVTKVLYLTEEKNIETDKDYILSNGTVLSGTNGNYTITCNKGDFAENQSELTYYIYAVNESGVMSSERKTVKLDETNPSVVSIVVDNETGWLESLFARNESISFKVSAQDTSGSGVASITLNVSSRDKTNSYTKSADEFVDGCALFELSLNERTKYTISVVATDNMGNESEPYTAIENKKGCKIEDGTIYRDSVASMVEVVETNHISKDSNGVYYIKDGAFDMKVNLYDYETEEDKPYVSGIVEYSVKVNETSVAKVSCSTPVKEVTGIEISTENISPVNETYTIEVYILDAAGNESTTTYTCKVDTTAPVVESIIANTNFITTVSGRYGYFSNSTITYTVNLRDDNASSGIEKVEYALKTSDGTVSNYVVATMIGNNEAQFIVPALFKGTVLVKATDNVGNVSKEAQPAYKMIAETKDKHDETSSISLTLDDTSYKDANGNNLYVTDTKVGVVVTDTYSGIAKIEWSVNAPYDTSSNNSGTITVDGSGATNNSAWDVKVTDENLATEIIGSIPVTNNSNDIVVTVTITDNAGNISTKQIKLSIDKTNPTVSIDFDSTTYNQHYMNTRTATITVFERNFDASKVNTIITNTEGVVPTVSGWTEIVDAQNPDNTKHVATVVFSADGDYTMNVAATDKVDRASSTVTATTFTIDKSKPVISVTFDNNDSKNGNYYNGYRTATITVNEHNFDANAISINGSATVGTTEISFPAISGWTSSGDVHTATIAFNNDAKYEFTINVADAAGNINSYDVGTFYIDTTVPEVSISGVEDNSANNGVVIPVISFTDQNFDANGVSIQLVGANNGTMEVKGSFSDTANGQIYTFVDFEEEQTYDDFYTLTVSQTDLAGNVTEQSISFSVNRFGSVYVLSDETSKINGKYVKDAIDVVITETNVNSLNIDTIKAVLIINGTPTTLVYGEDYTVEKISGNGTWSQYVYTFGKKLFKEDGSYSIYIYSEDAAGNVNENINESKEAAITFGIDTVKPIISAINFEGNKTIEETNFKAIVSISDNLLLESVVIRVNGKEVEYEVSGNEYSFTLPESNESYEITIEATDAAGNTETLTISEVFVNTSAFVSFINSDGIVVAGAVGGTAVVGGGAIFFFRRKNIIKVKRK